MCQFCEQPVKKHDYELMGKNYSFGHETCACDEAQHATNRYKSVYGAMLSEELRDYQRERIEKLIEKSMIPKRWKDRTFEHYEVNEKNRKSYELVKDYAESFNKATTEGLLFSGSVGTGKTHLAAAVALYLMEQEYRVVFGTVTTLLSKIRGTFGNNSESEQEVFDKLVRCQLLIVDDIGKEKSTDWVEQTLYEIVNSRYENNKPLILTTNFGLAELKQRYPNVGEALVDRILEMCRGVKLVGDSWRRKHLL